MLKLYNKTGNNLIGNLDNCIECVVEEERNGIFELIMTYPVVDAIYNSLEKENIIIANANDTLKAQKFRIYNIRKYMKNQVTVYARHISFDLMHDVIEEGISFTNQSCEYALNQIFRQSNFSKHYRGYSDIINAQNYKISMVNCLSAIAGAKGSIIDTFGTGAEILRDNTNIHVLNRRGHDNGVTIEYKKNLTGLTVEEDTTDLVTRIFPYACQKSEDNIETLITLEEKFVDANNIKQFAHPYISYMDFTGKFEQGETITQDKLRTLAQNQFRDNKVHIPKCNYKIEFIPLSKVVGYKELEDKISLCDTVTIKDTRYGIDTQAKVIKTVYNVLLDRYDSMELGEPKTTLGDVITNNGGSNNSGSNNGGTGGSDSEKVEIDDSNFPNIIPLKPVLSSNVMGFGSVEVSWTFENKSYFKYELYASKVKDFTPNSFYLIYSGQASAFLHVVEPNETWYYRVCGINSHGNRGEFSEQLTVNTTKLDDFEQYFSSLAVKNLVTNIFSVDYMKAGIVKGHWIDAKNLTVTDGNGKRTLDIDSFGNVNLNVSTLKINSRDINTEYVKQTDIKISEDGLLAKLTNNGGNNLLRNGGFENGLKYWNQNGWMSYNLTSEMPPTTAKLGTVFTDDRNARVNIRSGPGTNYSIIGWAGWGTVFTIVNEVKDSNGNVTWYQINYGNTTGWLYNQYLGDIRTVTSGYPTFSGTSLLIRAEKANTGVFQTFTCQPGKQYYCVFTAMKDPVFPCKSTVIGIEGINGVNINPNLTWEQYAFQFTATKTEHTFIAYANGAGNFYIDNIMVAYGEVPTGYVDYSGELYSGIVKIDADGLRIDFEDGTYSMMGRDGFKYYVGGNGNTYCSLIYTGSFSVSSAFYGSTMGITLPSEFRNKNIKVLVFPVEYSCDEPFAIQKVLCQVWGAINYSTAHFTIRYGCHVQDTTQHWNNKDVGMTVGYIAMA